MPLYSAPPLPWLVPLAWPIPIADAGAVTKPAASAAQKIQNFRGAVVIVCP
jgi:hypothetical protein